MCWKKQHDVQPSLGHHGSALPSLKPFKFSSTAGAASMPAIAWRWQWQILHEATSFGSQIDARSARKSRRRQKNVKVISWEVWGSKHSWHLLGSRGFGSLQKSKLKKLSNVWAMLHHAWCWILLSRLPASWPECPWWNLSLDMFDIKSGTLHCGHWTSLGHETKLRVFASRQRRCEPQGAVLARRPRLHRKLLPVAWFCSRRLQVYQPNVDTGCNSRVRTGQCQTVPKAGCNE